MKETSLYVILQQLPQNTNFAQGEGDTVKVGLADDGISVVVHKE